MFSLNRTFLFSALTLAIHSVAYANIPNAGTITRDIEQENQPKAVQAVTSQPKLAREAQASDAVEIEVQKIRFVGVESFSEAHFAALAAEYEGKTVTLGQLRDLTEKVTAYYNQQGFQLAKAVLPPQRIEHGVVEIRVFEGKVSGIQLANHSRLQDSIAQAYLEHGISAGKALNRKESERALLLLRDLAGVGAVNYSLAEGTGEGETVLVANLEPAPLLQGNLSLDNHGSESTGEKRLRANLYLQNPAGLGERIILQAMTSAQGLDYGRLSLELPIGYDGLIYHSGISRTRYELGGAFENLKAEGSSDVLEAGIRYPLIRSNQTNLWLSAGTEVRYLTDRVQATQTETKKAVRVGNFGINGSVQDSLLAGGYTAFGLYQTAGHLDIRSPVAREIDSLSAKTQGGYYKINANLSRTQYFSENLSLWANLTGQWSNKNLDSGEQLSLGGLDGVSAYSSNVVSGDKGIIANLQLRYAINPYIAVSTFYDAGRVKIRNKPYTSEKNHRSLQGAGIGLNIQVKNFSLELKTAWKINKPQEVQEKSPRFWLKGTYQF